MAAAAAHDSLGAPSPHQVSKIAPYRWHVISNVASKLGWKWTQAGDSTDRFSKDGVVLTVSWTDTAMRDATGTNGLAIVAREGSKLQKLCRALGADIRDDQKFASLPTGNTAKLPDINSLRRDARTGLKLVEEPSAAAVSEVLPTFETSGTEADSSPEDVVDCSLALNPNGSAPTSEDDAKQGGAGNLFESPAVEAVSIEAVPVAVTTAERVEFERAASGEAELKEAALTARFRTYLEIVHRREVKRYKITTPDGVLYTDTADVTAGVLYEAKGTAERMSVRLALGQVLDYGRYVDRHMGGAELAILLPKPPAADLIELLETHNVGCVVEGEFGEFFDMTALNRCP